MTRAKELRARTPVPEATDRNQATTYRETVDDRPGRLPLPLITFLTSTTEQARALTNASDLRQGRLVVAVPPLASGRGYRGMYRFVEAIIAAIAAAAGHDIGELFTQKTRHNTETAIAWIHGRRITEVIVVDAERFGYLLSDTVIQLLSLCGVRQWLVVRRPVSLPQRRAFDLALCQGASADDLTAHLGFTVGADVEHDLSDPTRPADSAATNSAGQRRYVESQQAPWPLHNPDAIAAWLTHADATASANVAESPQPLPSNAAPTFPPVPETPYSGFLPHCRETLPPSDHHTVHDHVIAVAHRVAAWLGEHRGTMLTDDDVISLLGSETAHARSTHEIITTLNTIQIVFSRGHYCIRFDPVRLIHSGWIGTSAVERGPQFWSKFARFPQPEFGAIAAVLDNGLTYTEAAALTPTQVSEDGRTITLPDRIVTIPHDASVFVRAQRAYALLHAPGINVFFLGHPRSRNAFTPKLPNTLAGALRRIHRELGVVIVPTRHRTPGVSWRRLIGFTLRPLP